MSALLLIWKGLIRAAAQNADSPPEAKAKDPIPMAQRRYQGPILPNSPDWLRGDFSLRSTIWLWPMSDGFHQQTQFLNFAAEKNDRHTSRINASRPGRVLSSIDI
jgi:hypothetical protein